MIRMKVSSVKSDGYGAKIGLAAGDIVDTINGVAIESSSVLEQMLDGASKFPTEMVVFREGERLAFTIKEERFGAILSETEIDPGQQIATEQAWQDNRRKHSIIVTTAPSIEGKRLIKTIKVIGSECVIGVNVFADILGGIRDVVGGRSGALQKKLKESRDDCLDALREEAFQIDANAVIAVRIEHHEIGDKGGYMMMVTATGTAVQVE